MFTSLQVSFLWLNNRLTLPQTPNVLSVSQPQHFCLHIFLGLCCSCLHVTLNRTFTKSVFALKCSFTASAGSLKVQQRVISSLRRFAPTDLRRRCSLRPTENVAPFSGLHQQASALKITAAHQTLMQGHYETYYIFHRPSSRPRCPLRPDFSSSRPRRPVGPPCPRARQLSAAVAFPRTLLDGKNIQQLQEKQTSAPLFPPSSLIFSCPPPH